MWNFDFSIAFTMFKRNCKHNMKFLVICRTCGMDYVSGMKKKTPSETRYEATNFQFSSCMGVFLDDSNLMKDFDILQ
jgi:hypothetical protein